METLGLIIKILATLSAVCTAGGCSFYAENEAKYVYFMFFVLICLGIWAV